MSAWKLEDAKNRFSELVRRAASQGPQFVTKHGKEAAVVLSAQEYRALTQSTDLVDFLCSSPLADALQSGDLKLERSREPSREVDI